MSMSINSTKSFAVAQWNSNSTNIFVIPTDLYYEQKATVSKKSQSKASKEFNVDKLFELYSKKELSGSFETAENSDEEQEVFVSTLSPKKQMTKTVKFTSFLCNNWKNKIKAQMSHFNAYAQRNIFA